MRRLEPDSLSRRDIAILCDLSRVRLLTGAQLERLHFARLANKNARGSARRRSLGRLVGLGMVSTLPRRVGGERAGSAGLIYTLDARAQRERALWQPATDPPQPTRARRPWAIGWLFVSHGLDVAELYVRLREDERAGRLTLLRFDAEPASWHQTFDGLMKPDAYVVLEANGWERHWWIEVDRATESLPTLSRKLDRYLDLFKSGQPGPDGLLPRVLVTTPDARRRQQVQGLLTQLPASGEVIRVADFESAVRLLPGEQARPPP